MSARLRSPVMTTVVGVDLAWGDRAASGIVVAAAGPDGAVVTASATVVDDDAIAAMVPDGPVVVALDAPIVVPNATGRRDCDAAVSRCFARFHAGTYPANRSIPWLAQPRAGRLAARLGLALEPGRARDRDARVALEVYPHAAAVVLFGLDRVLPYKPRRRRDLAERRTALSALLDHLEGLADADPGFDVAAGPRWPVLRTAVAGAATKAALDRVEDEVDAHLCAYVGVLAALQPGRLAVAGTPSTGAIVTPVTAELRRCLGAPP